MLREVWSGEYVAWVVGVECECECECRSLEDVRDREVDAEGDVVVEVVVVVVGYERGGYGPSDGESPRRGDAGGEAEEKGRRGDEEGGSKEGEGEGEETSGMIGIDRDVAPGCGGARRDRGWWLEVGDVSTIIQTTLLSMAMAMAMVMPKSKLRGMGCKRASDRQCKHKKESSGEVKKTKAQLR
jgi:hypothetical protein